MTRSRATLRDSSVWSPEQVEAFLEETTIPIRLAMLTQAGAPLVCSLWYLHDAGRIYCATQNSSKVVSLLEDKPEVAFEIAGDVMPYRGVRGQGRVTISRADGPRTLERLMARYLPDQESQFARWLRSRSASEVALVIEPEWLTSWDFSGRMAES